MLRALRLENVGPSSTLHAEFGSRLNVITGDNGLGKSFLLDVIWWCLTRTWPQEVNPRLTSGAMARPRDRAKDAVIEFEILGSRLPLLAGDKLISPDDTPSTQIYDAGLILTPEIRKIEHHNLHSLQFRKSLSYFNQINQSWELVRNTRPLYQGICIYGMTDSNFAIWDSARNYWKHDERRNTDALSPIRAYAFDPQSLWNGLQDQHGTVLCNGLISDWAAWQDSRSAVQFDRLKKALSVLSKGLKSFSLVEFGDFTRLSVTDARRIPTLKTPYSETPVPLQFLSSAMRRIMSFVYLLIWSWEEHVQNCRLLGRDTANHITLLIDEAELHLHPSWQRLIIPTLIEAVKTLKEQLDVQIIFTTHAPLILSSIEPDFDPATDRWFDIDFDAENRDVTFQQRPFIKQGDASNWLVSQAFDLPSASNAAIEAVMKRFDDALAQDDLDKNAALTLYRDLLRTLPEQDAAPAIFRDYLTRKGWRP